MVVKRKSKTKIKKNKVANRKPVSKNKKGMHKKNRGFFLFKKRKKKKKEKSPKKQKTHQKSRKIHKKRTGNKLLKVYFMSYVVTIAYILCAFVYKNWAIGVIGVCLMFLTLLFYRTSKWLAYSKIRKLEEYQLKDYVEMELREGFSLRQITKALIKAGHPKTIANEIVDKIYRERHPEKAEKKVASVNQVKKKVKKEIKKEDSKINKLLEKEKLLDRIKLKRKVMLFLVLFLFSMVPLYFGYRDMNWLTLSLGVLLLLITMFGLFSSLTRLKKMKKRTEKEPEKAEKKEPLKKEVKKESKSEKKAEKKIKSAPDKKKTAKMVRFIAIIFLLIVMINLFIFFLPVFSTWVYITFGALVFLIFLAVILISKKKPQGAIKEHTQLKAKEVAVVVDEDIKRVLKITDELLGNLPDDKIAEFSKSPDFELYERVLNKYNVK